MDAEHSLVYVDELVNKVTEGCLRLMPGEKLVQEIYGTLLKVKLMQHSEKKKKAHKSYFISNCISELPPIGEHSIRNVIPAAIRRSITHKNEITGVLENLKQPADRGMFNKGYFLEFFEKVHKYMKESMAESGVTIPMTEDEYVESAADHKRKLYRSKKKSGDIQVDLRKSDYEIRARIKPEKKKMKDDLIFRLFFPRGTLFHIRLGRYIKCLEEHLYKAINRVFGELFGMDYIVVVTKGLNSPETAELFQEAFAEFKDPCAFKFDCAQFDKHIHRYLLKYCHKLWLSFYEGSDKVELQRLLRHQLNNRMDVFTDDGYRVSWETKGGVASGDVTTGCGNIFIMCACMYNFMRTNVTARVRFIDNGDDCTVVTSLNDRQQFATIGDEYETYGLTLKIEGIVTDIHKVVFCQTSPIKINNQWKMIRSLDAVFLKDMLCMQGTTLSEFKHWLFQVGTGGTILNDGVPVFQELYQLYLRVGERGELSRVVNNDFVYSGLVQLTKRMTFEALPITSENRLEFYHVTGLVPELQIALEEWFKSADPNMIFTGPVENSWSSGLPPHLASLIIKHEEENKTSC